MVVATGEHRQALKAGLREKGLDVDAAVACGQLVMLDAAATLTQFMGGGSPDPGLFAERIGGSSRARPRMRTA